MSEIQQKIAQALESLYAHRPSNLEQESFYNGNISYKSIGIGLPPTLNGANINVPWGKIQVESLSDKVQFEGFTHEDADDWVDDVVYENELTLVASMAHRDAFICGTAYILTQYNAEGGLRVSAESPLIAYADKDHFGNVVSFIRIVEKKEGIKGFLILPDATYYFTLLSKMPDQEIEGLKPNFLKQSINPESVKITAYDVHNLGFVPVTQLINQARSSKPGGTPEIDHVSKSLISQAIQSYASIFMNRETNAIPMRYLLNVDLSNPTAVEERLTYGSVMTVKPSSKDADPIQIGQLPQSTNLPFLDALKAYKSEFAAHSGVPLSSMDMNQANPTSAEALEAQNAGLMKKAEERMRGFAPAWVKQITIWSKMLHKPLTGRVGVRWANPRLALTGPAAQADAIIKLVQSGVLSPNDDFVYTLLGMNRAQKEQQQRDIQKRSQSSALQVENSVTQIADALLESSPVLRELDSRGE